MPRGFFDFRRIRHRLRPLLCSRFLYWIESIFVQIQESKKPNTTLKTFSVFLFSN
jgi:hypothetical protein